MSPEINMDAWESIISNELLKRAMTVALCGQHTITVIGHEDNGAEHIKEIMGKHATFLRPCPCGDFNSYIPFCKCPPSAIRRHRMLRKWQIGMQSEIVVELEYPHPQDLFAWGWKQEPFPAERIEEAKSHPLAMSTSNEAQDLFETAALKWNMLGTSDAIRIYVVAYTIARMDDCREVKGRHMAEALQYSSAFFIEKSNSGLTQRADARKERL